MIINTEFAPKAIGPYSQGVVYGNLIYTAGQLPIDPNTGEFAGKEIKEQTKQSLKNIEAILEKAGSSMDKIIKTTVFLSDMNNFSGMNEVYAAFFKEGCYPARSAMEVSKLPKEALVEIEVVAYK